MDKYIKADDLLDAIYPLDPENDGSDGCTAVAVSLTLTSEELEEMIDSLPAADVAPMVHVTPMIKCRPERYEKYEVHGTSESGETLYLKRIFVDEKNRVMYCPACGKRLCSRFVNYCPNCGAKMDLEE